MHRVELDTPAICQNFDAANQRDVVIVDNIKAFRQNFLNVHRLEKWKTRLMGGQWREKAELALKFVHSDVGMIIIALHGHLMVKNTVGINAVDHIHLMPPLCQLV